MWQTINRLINGRQLPKVDNYVKYFSIRHFMIETADATQNKDCIFQHSSKFKKPRTKKIDNQINYFSKIRINRKLNLQIVNARLPSRLKSEKHETRDR